MSQYNAVPFSALTSSAPAWYASQCEPHAGEYTGAQVVLLMALEFGMPTALQGDGDGCCFVVELNGAALPQDGMVGTGPAKVLWVTEDLELSVCPAWGAEGVSITLADLMANYALVPYSPSLEGWLA